MQVMAAAKVKILPPGTHLHPAADDHQQLLVILRGAIHIAATADRAGQGSRQGSPVQQPAAQPEVLPDAEQPRLHNQTDAALLQTPGAVLTVAHEQQDAESDSTAGEAISGRAGQPQTGQPQTGQSQTGQSQAGQTPSSSASNSLVRDRDIPDARGCAFALPGLLQGTALEVHVTAETVVEAYSIPWSLIQVGYSSA